MHPTVRSAMLEFLYRLVDSNYQRCDELLQGFRDYMVKIDMTTDNVCEVAHICADLAFVFDITSARKVAERYKLDFRM